MSLEELTARYARLKRKVAAERDRMQALLALHGDELTDSLHSDEGWQFSGHDDEWHPPSFRAMLGTAIELADAASKERGND